MNSASRRPPLAREVQSGSANDERLRRASGGAVRRPFTGLGAVAGVGAVLADASNVDARRFVPEGAVRRRLAGVGAVLAVSLLAAGCTGSAASNVETLPPSPSASSQTPSPSPSPSESSQSPSPSPTPTPLPTLTPLPDDPRLASYYSQKLRWSGCGGAFECATLTVPRDYAKPGTADLGIKVLRLPASGARKGSLVLNPGGPGASGTDYARAARAVVSPSIRAAYDIVGFDPRGVASSDPIRCLTSKQTDEWLAIDLSPSNVAQIRAVDALSRDFGSGCKTGSPDLFAHVSTVEVARDLDLLRAVLGDEKLTYLGKSYGTFIGSTYAELFPSKVGRFVLDGALDPSLGSSDLSRGQAAGFEVAYRRFLADCLKQAGCPFTGSVVEAYRETIALVNRTQNEPIETGDSKRPLTQGLLVNCIAFSLYDKENGWPSLRFALASAIAGDGDTCLTLVDLISDRNSDGKFTTNGQDALFAVNSLDRPADADLSQTADLAKQWAATVSPLFGATLAWGNLPATYWPVGAVTAPHPATAPGTPPIVVVGTEFDPATPLQWAKALAGQLSQGVFLEWKGGDGHTAYRQGSSCIDAAINTYLLTGTPPADGTVCR